MIKDENGNVAVKYYQTIPKVVKVRDMEYAFVVRANICMAWIQFEHLDTVLSKTKSCCGGSRKHVFLLANEADVRRWSAGGGR